MGKSVWKSFEFKIVVVILAITLSLSVGFNFLFYNRYYHMTIDNLKNDARIVHQYTEEFISESSYLELNTREDEAKEIYIQTHKQLDEIRRIANILYLYTAKQNEAGEYIYVLDGLDTQAEDFRHVGDPIEEEIVPELMRCLNGENVLGDDILVTEWGIVYVTYFPVHGSDGSIIGAIGMEFDCENLYNSFARVRMLTIGISLALALIAVWIAVIILKKVVKNTEAVLEKKDQLLIAAKEEALESSRAKSDFLSRMSHEIRTPMNAIIGMTAIADNTNDLGKIRYCLSTIGTSSAQLLNLINDILDMSKIEAGKFELELVPFNIEKMLMRVCNLVIDRAEQKRQKLHIFLNANMKMRYVGDELRISQVITNLLSNAVKFTPEEGTVTLSLEEVRKEGEDSVLRFSVADTGIGMTQEQISKLFVSFEQGDGSVSRRFGGTGLGLAISKSLIEKMDGVIWAESQLGKGSVFTFEIKLERLALQDGAVIFNGITPSDLKVLIIDGEKDVREHFIGIMDKFEIRTEEAGSGCEALELVRAAKTAQRPFDVIFLDYALPDRDGLELAADLAKMIDKNTVIIMTSFLGWNKIEGQANALGIKRYVSKPLFPSSILDAINEVVGSAAKKLEIEAPAAQDAPDFSGVTLLLAEDIQINREIVAALLEDTGVSIDFAENGRVALEKFKADPGKYAMIIMDIQMPEMDGYEATKRIRQLDIPAAGSVPIVAMTANAFKEDIDKCIACGMNDHLAKPINYADVIAKIKHYTNHKAS